MISFLLSAVLRLFTNVVFRNREREKEREIERVAVWVGSGSVSQLGNR